MSSRPQSLAPRPSLALSPVGARRRFCSPARSWNCSHAVGRYPYLPLTPRRFTRTQPGKLPLAGVRSRRGSARNGSNDSPIQYDELVIEHDEGAVEIVVYNRAILLFATDSEVVRRIHEVCCRLEDLTARQRQSRLPKKCGWHWKRRLTGCQLF